MEFRLHQPSVELRPFIQCYLEADSSSSFEKEEHTLFPNGHSGIFFNFGNSGTLILKETYKAYEVSVFGQIDRHFTVAHWPGFYSLGVLLKPAVLSRFLRVDLSEFRNTAFDGQLIRNDFKLLYRQLQEEPSVIGKLGKIERYFMKVLPCTSYDTTLTHQALHLIDDRKISSIYQLAKHLRVSERHLEIQFNRTVGLSPKTYSLIQRFRQIEQQVRKMPLIQWNQMPFAAEYYDQNHFIKEFKRFTGRTPSGYLLENLTMGHSYLDIN